MSKYLRMLIAFFSSVITQTVIISYISLVFPDSFKLYFVVIIVLSILLFVLHRNIITPLVMLVVILLQFQVPGKYYTFELIPPGNYSYEQPGLENGIPEGYGLIMSDFLALWILSYLWYQFFRDKTSIAQVLERLKSLLIDYPASIIVFCLWGLSILLAVWSSFYRSFYPFFSMFVLFQHAKILVVYLIVLFLFKKYGEKGQYLLQQIITGILLFQSLLSGVQLFLQISFFQTSSVFQPTYIVPDESIFSFRPTGTFSYANQLALLIFLLLGSLLLLKAIRNKGKVNIKFLEKLYIRHLLTKRRKDFFELITVLSAVLILVLAQSRVIWLALLFGLAVFRRELIIVIQIWGKMFLKNLRTFSIILLFGGVVITFTVPRIVKSTLFFTEAGGGYLRYQMLNDGIQVLRSSPFWGYGVETNVYQLFQQVPEGYIKGFPFAIHNAYLQLAIDQGLIGMLLFFTPFIFLLRMTFNNWTRLPKIISRLISLLIVSILGYYFMHPSYGRVEFPFLGLVIGIIVFHLDTSLKRI